MPKFRKKPIIIEAIQWFEEMGEIDGIERNPEGDPRTPKCYKVLTLEGWLNISNGDWLITGIKGEKYPCKPDIFKKTYEKMED